MLNRILLRTENHMLTHNKCPYYNGSKQLCIASASRMIPPHNKQLRYCASDDYDNCSLYLCKALRSSRHQGLDRETLFDSGK